MEEQREDSDYRLLEGEQQSFQSWTVEQTAAYFVKKGLGDYEEVIMMHKITGKLLPHLSDQDLRDMGINIVGDRLMFRRILENLGKQARFVHRNKVIWEGTEMLYFGGVERCFMTCCGVCPDDPSTYKLYSNKLRIKTVTPARCGRVRLCCCHEYSTNNIDLTYVEDVDVQGSPAPCFLEVCCCAPAMDTIEVEIRNDTTGKTVMIVEGGKGDEVAGLILNQVEESQLMERS